jgi:uncharacterized damage-inducible protein DinB
VSDKTLREQLADLIQNSHAHAGFDAAVKGFPWDKAGVVPPGLPHSVWQLLEHIRIAQNDILEFSRSADHVSPEWPAGYWPRSAGPASESEWNGSIRAFRRDGQEFQRLLRDEKQDLYRPFPWGQSQTLLREALLIIDHNSHHLGQLILVRKALGLWPKS